MEEKYIYATKYHLIILLLVSIFVIMTFLVSNIKFEVFIGVIIFLVVVFIITWLSYKGKIPLMKIK